jgi:hypothetical protein
MNPDVLMGILRACIPLAVGAATYFGLGNNAQDTAIATAVATGIVAMWSSYTNTQAAKIQSVNAADNGVKVVSNLVSAPQANAPIPALTQAAKQGG